MDKLQENTFLILVPTYQASLLTHALDIPKYGDISHTRLTPLYAHSISSLCHSEGVDDVNETIDLDHDVEGLKEVPNLPRDILEALNRESERSKPNIEETEVINLADEGKKKKPVKVEVNFTKDMKDELITLLKEFNEIFAWPYQDMPGLDTEIVVHMILINLECPLVQQTLQRMKSDIILKIKEVEK